MTDAVKQIDNPFGIEFVTEAPPEPIKRSRDDDRWEMAKLLLAQNPNVWAGVKKYDTKGGAPAKASQINGDKFKTLPAGEYEARSTTDKDSSVLYLRLRPADEQANLKVEAEKKAALAKPTDKVDGNEGQAAPTEKVDTKPSNPAKR